MTEKELKQYKDIKAEIADINSRISDMKHGEVVQFCTVKGSDKYFPYTPKVFYVAGIDPADAKQREKKIIELLRQREVQRDELVKKQIEIEQFIVGIRDSRTRMIFRMHFIDGMTQIEISDKLYVDQSGVSRKIQNYLKTHKTHK